MFFGIRFLLFQTSRVALAFSKVDWSFVSLNIIHQLFILDIDSLDNFVDIFARLGPETLQLILTTFASGGAIAYKSPIFASSTNFSSTFLISSSNLCLILAFFMVIYIIMLDVVILRILLLRYFLSIFWVISWFKRIINVSSQSVMIVVLLL